MNLQKNQNSSDYSDWRRSKSKKIITNKDKEYNQKIFERELSAIQLKDDKKILEIGFGEGHFLAWASERGYQIFGIDTDRGYCKSAEENGFNVSCVDAIRYFSQLDGVYDLIVAFDVIELLVEHVKNTPDSDARTESLLGLEVEKRGVKSERFGPDTLIKGDPQGRNNAQALADAVQEFKDFKDAQIEEEVTLEGIDDNLAALDNTEFGNKNVQTFDAQGAVTDENGDPVKVPYNQAIEKLNEEINQFEAVRKCCISKFGRAK